MESTIKIIRNSIHIFLKQYNFFTLTAILAIPFSTSILISTSLIPDFLSFHSHLQSLFDAAGFPPESEFYSILTLKLSQTISCSILVLPFSLSFLLIAKGIVIHSLCNRKPPPSLAGILNSILQTQICNTLIIIAANATCFWALFIAFNTLQNLHIPSLFLTITGGIAYSIVVANALIICNLALILSGMELSGGFISILKACVLIKGRTAIALSLSLPVNMALAGIEFLFQFRIIKAYSNSGMNKLTSTMVLEGLFIAYLYSILIIIDAIIGCVFFKSCKIAYEHNIVDQEAGRIIEEEEDVALVKC
ncbi:hypothetical protein HanRHA438_Chr16g0741821 [Helianthus annuus]|nr:hypothetical protein HanIR_Chr16g0793281 [Helianthus annuus]KAJ0638512.1 hypothetical protein HanHA300_Chr00c0107g0710871 [Helianthus annuus]KAJ0643609.1 hypothetical protein HanOQP8_Chr16g0602411 [Helianthus annuus]KAJ0819719.1 hypothetical protein HanPSC8_Chr16g0699281 [Helianthus annuus]KAJ0834277.1 hypothetical protein HanRHA438_Chr16g0741821 [Helianthus annuus]